MAIREINFGSKKLRLQIEDEADHSVLEEIFLDKEYRQLEDLIKRSTSPIIDIGAHKGFFSIYASLLNPNVQIFSYEPEQANYQSLKANLKENNIKNVHAKNLAISDQAGSIKLHIAEDSHNHSLVSSTENTQTVNSLTLSQILKADSYSLAKIDCEGAEFQIFASTPIEDLQKIANYYIEYHQQDPQPIIAKLQSAGYKVRSKVSPYDPNLGFIHAKR
jgi:FkbM family methyltransferase